MLTEFATVFGPEIYDLIASTLHTPRTRSRSRSWTTMTRMYSSHSIEDENHIIWQIIRSHVIAVGRFQCPLYIDHKAVGDKFSFPCVNLTD